MRWLRSTYVNVWGSPVWCHELWRIMTFFETIWNYFCPWAMTPAGLFAILAILYTPCMLIIKAQRIPFEIWRFKNSSSPFASNRKHRTTPSNHHDDGVFHLTTTFFLSSAICLALVVTCSATCPSCRHLLPHSAALLCLSIALEATGAPATLL